MTTLTRVVRALPCLPLLAMPVVILVCATVTTRHAVAMTARVYPHIVAGELVPVNAMRLSCLSRGRTLASQDVELVRDRLEVQRVAARAHATEVVKLKALGHRSDEQAVGRAMRFHALSVKRGVPVSRLRVAIAGIDPALVDAMHHATEKPEKNRDRSARGHPTGYRV